MFGLVGKMVYWDLVWFDGKMCVLHIEEFSCQDHADHSKFIPFSITQKEKTKTKKHSHIHPPARKVQNHSIILTSWNILKMWNESMNQWLVKLRYWSTPAVSQSSGKSLVSSLVWKKKRIPRHVVNGPMGCEGWTLKVLAAENYCIPWKRDGNLNRKCIWTNQWFSGRHSLVFGGL